MQLKLSRLSSVRDNMRIGSSTIQGCVPNDYDIMVLLRDEEDASVFLAEWADAFGRLFGGLYPDTEDLYNNSDWCSVRVREGPINLNLILTTNEDFFRAQSIAQRVCERLKLTDRGDRLMVFNTVHLEYR